MSNAPFKIAFWVMGLAFCLTVLLTSLKPEELRLAMNADKAKIPEALPKENYLSDEDDSLLAVNATLPVTSQLSMPAADSMGIVPAPYPIEREVASDSRMQPIRVASADLDAHWGHNEPEPTLSKTLEIETNDRMEVCRDASGMQAEIDILVPEPMLPIPDPTFATPESDVAKEVIKFKKDLLRIQLADARKELELTRLEHEQQEVKQVEAEIESLRLIIAEMRNQQLIVENEAVEPQISSPSQNTPPIPMETHSSEPLIAQVVQETIEESTTLAADESELIEVQPGSLPQRYHFTFDQANIHDVLRAVAKKIGWELTFRPDVEGTFTGRFANADPKQAFAAIIKSKEYGLSYRGNFVIVRGQKDPKVR